MKQEIIDALTDSELSTVVNSAVRLLYVMENIDGSQLLVTSLRKLLVQAFINEKEYYTEKYILPSIGFRNIKTIQCLAVKTIGECQYFSDGTVKFDCYTSFLLPPWAPKDPAVIKKIIANTEKYQRQCIKSDSAERMAQQQIEEADKEFWKELNRIDNLYMKYQMCKFTGKQFKVPKKFSVGNKTIWQFTDLLKEIIKTKKNIEPLESTIEKPYMLLKNLFQQYGSVLLVKQFNSTDDLSNSYRQRFLTVPYNANNPGPIKRYWSLQKIIVEEDPDIEGYNYFSMEEHIISWVYTLQKLANTKAIDPELQEFLEILGIIRKEDDNK